MTTQDTTLPPHNIDAEEGVLGSLLMAGAEAYREIDGLLKPGDFYGERHGRIFAACVSLRERGEAVNQIGVAQELMAAKALEAAGGAAYLSHLIAVCATPLDVRHYAQIVARAASYRALIGAGQQIKSLGLSQDPELVRVLEQAERLINDVRRACSITTVVTPDERIRRMADRYERLTLAEHPDSVPTGIASFDDGTAGGFYKGELTVVGGRPGMGKTNFLQCLANNISRRVNVLFCSGEMTLLALGDRDVAGALGVSMKALRSGNYHPEFTHRITELLPTLGEMHIYTMEPSMHTQFSTSRVFQAAVEVQNRWGLGCVFVDYLGQLEDSSGANQNERLGHISRRLKQMSLQLDVPIVAAHQLSRDVERREDKHPQLFDLRESGHIEEDADNVLFLYRKSYYATEYIVPDEQPEDEVEVIIAKARQGMTGTVCLRFNRRHRIYRSRPQDADALKRTDEDAVPVEPEGKQLEMAAATAEENKTEEGKNEATGV